MCLLGVFGFGAVHARRFGQEIGTDFVVDVVADFGYRVLRQGYAVGTHIGNQADRALADIHAFEQLLGGAHGAVGGEAELAHGVLLHGGSGVGRGGLAGGFFLHHVEHLRRFALHGGQHGGLGGFVGQGELLQFAALPLGEFGGKFLAAFVAVEVHAPVFLRFKGADFVFALANQAQGGALHAAGAQAAPDFFPQQRGEVEADQVIQGAACLLCVHQAHIELARLLEGFLHAFFSNLVEHHAQGALVQIFDAAFGFEDFVDMPRNGFAFAVRVGGQIEGVGFFSSSHDGVDVLFALGWHFVFHGEIVLGIDSAVFRHQIAHMAEGGQYFKIAAQVFFN